MPAGAAHFDQLFGARVLDQRLEHRERQPHPLGERQAGRLAAVERLDQQLLDLIDAPGRSRAASAGTGGGGATFGIVSAATVAVARLICSPSGR